MSKKASPSTGFRTNPEQGRRIRVHLFISGRVQEVFFRFNTARKAEELSVFGWVKNLTDGRIEMVIEGEKENVEKLLEWTKRGPLLAKVNGIEVNFEEYKGEFDSFKVRH